MRRWAARFALGVPALLVDAAGNVRARVVRGSGKDERGDVQIGDRPVGPPMEDEAFPVEYPDSPM